ncbi:hypothetical protein PHMEG_00015095 [Phytophthora megakarya]|uniref:MULE transposase domain-containing protein n=1 Tax=Phytophthora megakarya TaxID=4795 RepID=A0A225W3P7_9STRA|nr:hypothetical protein PHMEG_00015095 [Phytophthora megakarya]
MIIERRLRCGNRTCKRNGPVYFTIALTILELMERMCGPRKSVITTDMKKFILRQDELRKCAYNPTGDLDRAVCFGYQDDVNGYPYIGIGTDADLFVVGVTSISLVTTCIEYTASSRFTLFHADATFKLSDLGYPQLATILVVNRRTEQEYVTRLSVLVRVVKRICPSATLNIDMIMGDAEDAQVNGFQPVSIFSSSTYSCVSSMFSTMSARERDIWSRGHRKAVMDGIVRIHYTGNMTIYYSVKDSVIGEWRAIPELACLRITLLNNILTLASTSHTDGFCHHKNPCEVSNAILKKYTGRRRLFIQRLLSITMTVVSDAVIHTHTPESSIPPTDSCFWQSRNRDDCKGLRRYFCNGEYGYVPSEATSKRRYYSNTRIGGFMRDF